MKTLNANACLLLRDTGLNTVTGIGTRKLSAHYEAIVKAGGKFYLSGMSSKARGLTDAGILDKSTEFAMPTVLIKLAAESDRMFTY